MRLLGILWNSVGLYKEEALNFIGDYGKIIDYIDIDLGDDYENFIRELYPFNKMERWKAEYKIEGLVNQYDSNHIRILLMEMPKSKKVYLPNKDKMMYENVLDLKVKFRKKYNDCISMKKVKKNNFKSYDNVFHMSDDEAEYSHDVKIVIKYLSKYEKRRNGFLEIDKYVDKDSIKKEKWGTRNNLWLNKNIMFKENTKGTYEALAEIFNMYLMKKCGLNPPFYDLAIHQGMYGVITFNVLHDNEYMIDGSHVMSEDESFTKKELIEHNNLEMLPKIIMKWCIEKGLNYNEKVIEDLEELYIYDLLSLQPDRNPSNYAIAVNKETKDIRLVYFDNGNMFYCDNKDAIELYKKGNLNIDEYIKNMKTFLLHKSSSTCFDDKCDMFREYYLSITKEKQNYVKFLLEQMNYENIVNIFMEIEKDKKINLPNDFKTAILEAYGLFHSQLYNFIKEQEEPKKLIFN